MPGDPTVARLTLQVPHVQTHNRRVFLSSQPDFFHPLSLHLMSPHAASCIAVRMRFRASFAARSPTISACVCFRPRHPIVNPVGLAEGVVSEGYHHPRHRHPNFPISPDRLPTMRRRVFPDLPVKIVHREQGIPTRPGKTELTVRCSTR